MSMPWIIYLYINESILVLKIGKHCHKPNDHMLSGPCFPWKFFIARYDPQTHKPWQIDPIRGKPLHFTSLSHLFGF